MPDVGDDLKVVDLAAASTVGEWYLGTRGAHGDTKVKEAYRQLQVETDQLFTIVSRDPVSSAARVVFTRCSRPYASDAELIAAVSAGGTLEVTSAATAEGRLHPIFDCGFGGAFDRFRAVHDLIGHAWCGYGFALGAEYAACRVQDRLHSGLARCALATELYGVNAARRHHRRIARAQGLAPSSPRWTWGERTMTVPSPTFGLDTFGDVTHDRDDHLVSHAQTIRNVVEQGAFAEHAGVDFFGIGEHHTSDFPMPAGDVVLGAIAARTTRIRLGSAVTVLSSDDPVRVFQRYSTLAAISNGRAEVILGRGSSVDSFSLFGYDLADYERLFEEKVDVFAELLKGGVINWQGTTRAPLSNKTSCRTSSLETFQPGSAWVGVRIR